MKFVIFCITSILIMVVLNSCVKSTNDPIAPPESDSSHAVKNIRIHPDNGKFDDTIVLKATNISSADSFLINGIRAKSLEVHGDSVQLIVPFSAGSGPVTIAFGNGQICIGPNFHYNYTNYVTTIGGTGAKGADDPDGLAIHAAFDGAYGVAVDDAGDILMGENGKVRKIHPDGTITTFAGTGVGGFTDGPGNSAQFNSVFSIVLDNNGNAYLADEGNNAIRKITPDGIVSTLAGTGARGHNDGPGVTATFDMPFAVALDAQGNILVADFNNYAIRKITPSGLVSTVVTGPIHQNVDGRDTTFDRFSGPQGICADAAGNIYVSDGATIRKIAVNGVVTNVAGDGNYGDVDGLGTAAQFYIPMGLVFDSKGNLLISDFGAAKIKKLAPDGMVTTIAGCNYSDFTFLDGPALSSRFWGPVGIALDKNENIYVGDNNNLRLRKINMQ